MSRRISLEHVRSVYRQHLTPQLGHVYACARFSLALAQKLRWNGLIRLINTFCHKRLISYLESHYRDVISSHRQLRRGGDGTQRTEPRPIWCMWWQGAESMPPLVACCIKSIEHHASGHPVHLITRDNYRKYVTLSSEIIRKFEAGEMRTAHFSDVVRVNLLKIHGGLWVDSTIYVSRDIPDSIFSQPFFSIRENEPCLNISNGRWTTFLLASSGESCLMPFLADMYNAYWSRESCVLDYFLFDYLIYVGYANVPDIRREIDCISINNTQTYALSRELNKPFDPDVMRGIMEIPDTYLFKLNYKNRLKESENTFYRYILKRL